MHFYSFKHPSQEGLFLVYYVGVVHFYRKEKKETYSCINTSCQNYLEFIPGKLALHLIGTRASAFPQNGIPRGHVNYLMSIV